MTIKKYIPNTITSMNLLCGAVGVICTFKGEMPLAFTCMLLAAVFDFCDGLAARLLKAYSPIGKELDSLCDMVSFGLLPSLMLGQNGKVKTLPVAVQAFVGSYVKQWDLILTAALLAILPMIIIFVFAQKQIMTGMVEGAVK